MGGARVVPREISRLEDCAAPPERRGTRLTTLPTIDLNDPEFFDRRCALTPLPRVVQQVLARAQQFDVNVDDVAELIEQDATLAARVLAVANSAYYALPTRVGNLRYAIAYLGLAEISRVVLGVAALNQLSGDVRLVRPLWVHSYLVALSTKRIRRFTHPYTFDSDDQLYVAALLHDLGKFVYVKAFHKHAAAIAQHASKHQVRFCDAEAALGFVSHSEMGAKLCDYWRFPSQIRAACLSHELEDLEDPSVRSDPLLLIVTLSNLAAERVTEEINDGLADSIDNTLCEQLRISDSEYVGLCADIQALHHEAQQAISALT